MKVLSTYLRMVLLLGATALLGACNIVDIYENDNDGPEKKEDIVTEVKLYVSAETGIYYLLFDDYREHPYEGIRIREEGEDRWSCTHFSMIKGFTYEKGYDYELLVKKTILLANPPQDSGNVEYELISIISKTKPDTAEQQHEEEM